MTQQIVTAWFKYDGRETRIALLSGITTTELATLLKAVLQITQGTLVGVMSAQGVVIPLSVLCKNPEVLPSTVCELLVSGGVPPSMEVTSPTPVHVSSSIVKKTAPVTYTPTDSSSSSTSESSEPRNRLVAARDVFTYLGKLKQCGFLSEADHALLVGLVEDKNVVLLAAYAVAVTNNDAQYFADNCAETAENLQTEEGRISCEAQDEVLTIVETYCSHQLSDDDLLALYHLVLQRDERVAEIYDSYQDHQSDKKLAKDLYTLVMSGAGRDVLDQSAEDEEEEEEDLHASYGDDQSENSSTSEELQEDEEESVEDELDDHSVSTDHDDVAITLAGIHQLATTLYRKQVISQLEAVTILKLASADNEYVMASFDLFQKDGRLEELVDTWRRCVRIEIHKNVQSQLQSEEAADDYVSSHSSASEEESEELGEQEDEEDEHSEEEDEEDEHSEEEDDKSDDSNDWENISLEAILEAAGASDKWTVLAKDRTLSKFAHVTFAAVVQRKFTLGEAEVATHLMLSDDVMMKSAWDVYSADQDKIDFLDTLRRIIRLHFESTSDSESTTKKQNEFDGETKESKMDSVKDAPTHDESINSYPVADAKSVPTPTKSVSATGSVTSPIATMHSPSAATLSPATVIATAENMKSPVSSPTSPSAIHRKEEAHRAVDSAKSELLKHSLQMMTYKNVLSESDAQYVINKFTAGDVDIDEAIRKYAVDRDAPHFFMTLQKISEMSKETTQPEKTVQPEELSQSEKLSVRQQELEAQRNKAVTDLEDLALSQVNSIVKQLEVNNMVGPAITSIFYDLIEDRDQRLVSAFESYVESSDGNAFVEQLLAIVLESTTQENENGDDEEQEQEEEEEEVITDEPNSTNVTLDLADVYPLVDALSDVLSPSQHDYLQGLVAKADPSITSLLDVYRQDNNLHRFVEGLHSILLQAPELSEEALLTKTASPVKSEVVEESSDEALDEDSFIDLLTSGYFNPLQTSVLIKAVSEGHPDVTNALNAYRQSGDQQALVAAMTTMAERLVVKLVPENVESDHSTVVSQGGVDAESAIYDEGDESEEDDDAPALQSEIVHEEESLADSTTFGSQILDTEIENEFDVVDKEEVEENEEESLNGPPPHDDFSNDEEEDEEDDESRLATLRATRDQVMYVLAEEFVSTGLMTSEQSMSLLTAYDNSNPGVHTALDEYEEHGDMEKFLSDLKSSLSSLSQ